MSVRCLRPSVVRTERSIVQGIDISHWQNGIDLGAVDVDFVIVKATEGYDYVSPQFSRQIKQAERTGRLLGAYHYVNGDGAAAEARHFAKTIKPWLGKAIPMLDWEGNRNDAFNDVRYLEKVVKAFIDETGIVPFIYASRYYYPWSLAEKYGCGKWVAQYDGTKRAHRQSSPAFEGEFACDIRQYSGTGRLPGYEEDLDLDKAYLTPGDWRRLAAGERTTARIAPKWIASSIGWWIQYADGSYPKNEWCHVGGHWYRFDERGYAVRGWQKVDEKWYWFCQKGEGAPECSMATGWLKRGGRWYYLNPKGDMATGWKKVDGAWYWLRCADDKTGPEGSMATGWLKLDGNWYYLRPSRVGGFPEGSMVTGRRIIDGTSYVFDGSGALV
ncbi:hypothetical protein GMI69_05855 [Eggerthellaceae bacterium zg-887]|nr:hypothetical protein [Xiamenia xianingshaonis]